MTQFKNKPLIKGSSGSLLLGSILGGLIGFSPYIFYIYEIFPDGPIWRTSYFVYESLYYQSVATVAWTYLGKVMPLFLLIIWFFTCRHWWYHAILIPLGMYVYQIVVTFYADVFLEGAYLMDVNGLLYLAPYFIAILCIVYLIRIKVFDRIYGIDLTEIERGTNLSVFSPFTDKEFKEYQEMKAKKDKEEEEKERRRKEDSWANL